MKKILCILLVSAVAAGFCGCSVKKEQAGGNAPVLTWYVPGDSQPDQATVMNEVNKIIKERIGATLDIKFIDTGAFPEKIKMMMAAKDDFDLCFTGWCNSYQDAVKQGGLYCIDELLKTAPALIASLPDYLFEVAMVDGKIYGVPNYQLNAYSHCLVINKNLAEKYNLDTSKITKTTDIETFLEKIKQNEPNYYPFSVNWGTDSISSVDDPVYTMGTENIVRFVPDGKSYKIESVFDDTLKKKAKILYDWYQKGYIRKDAASVMDETAQISAGKYAVILENYKPNVEPEFEAIYGYPVVVANISPRVFQLSRPLSTMISINAFSKNPELSLKVIELVNTDKDLYNMICYGIEGKHYTKTGENRIELITNSGYNPAACWKFGNNFNAWLLPGQADDVWEVSKQMNENSQKVGIPGFTFDDSAIRIQLAQIKTVTDKYKIIRTGAQNPDEYYDTYLSELDKAGLPEVISEYQKQVDEFCKKRG